MESCFLCHLFKGGAVRFQGQHTEDLLALVMCSEHGNGALTAFDNIQYPCFGWLLTMLLLASPLLFEVWCQGQLLSDTCTVSDIIHDIVPGGGSLVFGVDLGVPVHLWNLDWKMRFGCSRPVHSSFSGLGHHKKQTRELLQIAVLGGVFSTASTRRWQEVNPRICFGVHPPGPGGGFVGLHSTGRHRQWSLLVYTAEE